MRQKWALIFLFELSYIGKYLMLLTNDHVVIENCEINSFPRSCIIIQAYISIKYSTNYYSMYSIFTLLSILTCHGLFSETHFCQLFAMELVSACMQILKILLEICHEPKALKNNVEFSTLPKIQHPPCVKKYT